MKEENILFLLVGLFGLILTATGIGVYFYINEHPELDVETFEYDPRIYELPEPKTNAGGSESLIELPEVTFAFPVDSDDWYITSPWGKRVSPIYGFVAHHDGVDISIDDPRRGMPQIVAIADGYIEHHWYNHKTKGRYIIVNHGWGRSHYAHLSTSYIHERNPDGSPWQVQAGEVIGRMGNTGLSDGAHLHFELELFMDGVPMLVNPMLYLEEVLTEWEAYDVR